MLRCIAVDDEPLALELLEDNISKVPYLQLVAKCSNAMEAIKVLQGQSVDLIFSGYPNAGSYRVAVYSKPERPADDHTYYRL